MTKDTVHRLSGEGEQISAILGTLAFLFMDDPFKSVNVCIGFQNERVPVQLYSDGSMLVPDCEYEGIFANAYMGEKRKAMVTVLLYTKILPALFKCYEKSIQNDTWNTQVKDQFRKSIGEQIISIVNANLVNELDISTACPQPHL